MTKHDRDIEHGPVRPVVAGDLPAIKRVIQANELFPPEMLDDMTAGYFKREPEAGYWLTLDAPAPIAVAYYAAEYMTQGTWNLHLIAVHPDHHGQGVGSLLISHIEKHLAGQGERILIVETSALEHFTRTRNFYLHCGYHQEACIRGFYAEGEDKIVFWKDLSRNSV